MTDFLQCYRIRGHHGFVYIRNQGMLRKESKWRRWWQADPHLSFNHKTITKKLQQHQSYHWYSCLYNRMSESGKNPVKKTHTLFEIFIFCPKIQLWFPEKIADFLGGEKLVKNVVVLDYLAVDNFDFPRKLSIFLGEKLVKMLWFWTFSLKIYELLIVNSCF